jgi:predicted nucleic acid-binding protein
MAAPAQRIKFALDSNILIDLGERKNFAHTFLAAYRSQGLAAPPTVVQELTHLALVDTSNPASQFAFEALANMRQWDIFPYDLKSVGHGITDVDAQKLITKGLLPEGEFNDGLIIIETALAGIPSLVTSDNHLLSINQVQLTTTLGEFDLPPVTIFHPRDLLRAIK